VIDATLLGTLRRARHVAILTGAGVSAESGIPTFRDRLTGLCGSGTTRPSSRRRPAASPIELARRAGATTVQVNPNPTDAERAVDHVLRGKAGQLLPDLVTQAFGA